MTVSSRYSKNLSYFKRFKNLQEDFARAKFGVSINENKMHYFRRQIQSLKKELNSKISNQTSDKKSLDKLRLQISVIKQKYDQAVYWKKWSEDYLDIIVYSYHTSPPPEHFSTLDKKTPIALFPIRLETRFAKKRNVAQNKIEFQLLVRVFPDSIHVKTHEPELTEQEYRQSHKFWIEYFLSGKDEQSERTQAVWSSICNIFGQPRTEWITRQTKSSSLHVLDNDNNAQTIINDNTLSKEEKVIKLQDVLFTGITPTTESWSRAPYTDILPDYWVAVAIGRTKKDDPIIRSSRKKYGPIIGNPITHSLSLGPSPFSEHDDVPLPDESGNCPEGWQLSQNGTRCIRGDEYLDVDEGMQWMVDFEKAEEVGMALRIPIDYDYFYSPTAEIEQLLVFGVKSLLNPNDSSSKLEELFASHRYTDGFEFMLTGTPTNNTPEDKQKCKPIVNYVSDTIVVLNVLPYVKPEDVSNEDTQIVLDFLNHTTATEIDNKIKIAWEIDIGEKISQKIIQKRNALGGKFSSLREVRAISHIGDERFTEIISILTNNIFENMDLDNFDLFLKNNFSISWIKLASLEKSDDYATVTFSYNNENVAIKFVSKLKAKLFINNSEKYEFFVKREEGMQIYATTFGKENLVISNTRSSSRKNKTNEELMIKYFGFNQHSDVFYNLNHFDNTEHTDPCYMNTILWPSSFEYILKRMLVKEEPHSDFINKFRNHFINYVNGRGILPTIRCGNTPYGILPVTDIEGLKFSADNDNAFDSNLKDAVNSYLFDHWKSATYDLPFVGKSNYSGKSAKYLDILSILSRNPHSVRHFARPVFGIGYALGLARLVSAGNHLQEDIDDTIIPTMTNVHNSAVNNSPLPQNLLNNLQTTIFSPYAFELGKLVRPENTSDESWDNDPDKNYLSTFFDNKNDIEYLHKDFLNSTVNPKPPILSLILRNSSLLAYYYSAVSLPVYFEDVWWVAWYLGEVIGHVYVHGRDSSDNLISYTLNVVMASQTINATNVEHVTRELGESYKIKGRPHGTEREIVARNRDGHLIYFYKYNAQSWEAKNVHYETNSENDEFKIINNPLIIDTWLKSDNIFGTHIFAKNKDGFLIRFSKRPNRSRYNEDGGWDTPEKYDNLLPIINEPVGVYSVPISNPPRMTDQKLDVFATNSAGQLIHIRKVDFKLNQDWASFEKSIDPTNPNDVIVSNLYVWKHISEHEKFFIFGRNNFGDLIEYSSDNDGNWSSRNITADITGMGSDIDEKIVGNIQGTGYMGKFRIFSKNSEGDLILYSKNESENWECLNISKFLATDDDDYKLKGNISIQNFSHLHSGLVVGRHRSSDHVIVFKNENDDWEATDLNENIPHQHDFLASDTPIILESHDNGILRLVVAYRNFKGKIVSHLEPGLNSWKNQSINQTNILGISFARKGFYNKLEPESVDMYSDDPTSTPWRLFSDTWPPITGTEKSIGQWLQEQIDSDIFHNQEIKNLQEFWNSVNKLREMKIPHLENLFRESLDLCSHRLDAWLTSFVVKSLDSLHQKNPSRGVHIGAYGWLENIRANPKTMLPHAEIPEGEEDPIYINENNAGYVFTPSLPQATTAALLLDGHRRKIRESPDKPGSFAVNLSSDRVRSAISILQGVIEGQSVGALLGFLLERELQDKDLQRYIAPLREIAPLYVKKEETEPEKVGESVKSIAPRNVVDGLALIRRYHPDLPGLPIPWENYELPPKDENNPDSDYMKLKSILDRLVDSLDALKDILISESVYQGVHDIQVQTATFDAVSRGEPPPQEITVTKTPLTGIDITNRIVTLFKKPYNVNSISNWPTTQLSERAKAEPRINAWLSEILGDPGNTICQVTYLKWEPDIDSIQPSPVEVSLANLDLSPIDLVYIIKNIDSPQRSEIERRIINYAMKPQVNTGGIKPDNVLPNSYVKIDYQYESTEKTSFADIFEIAKTIRRVLDSSRPLKHTDLLSPGHSKREQNLDVNELYERFEETIKKFIEIHNLLQPVTNDEFYGSENNPSSHYSDSELEQIRQNLKKASQFGLHDSFPISLFGNNDNEQTLVHQQAISVKEEMNKQLKKIFGKDQDFDIDPYNSAEFSQLKSNLDVDNPDKLLQYFKIIFGESFIVLPSFDVNPEFYQALQNSNNVQSNSDSIPALTYVQRMSRIRESLTNFYESLSYCEAMDNGVNLEFKVAQLPIPDPDNDPTQTSDQWVNLESSNVLQGGRLSIVVHDPTNIVESEKIVGLLIDEIVETVPNKTQTGGLTFNLDVPGSQPPQSILLAVPPDPTQNWSIETIETILKQTIELSKIRMVDPEDMSSTGHFLPALYFAFNSGNPAGTISTDFLSAAKEETK